MASLQTFVGCITLARPDIVQFTAADLRNTTFRAQVCPGGVGLCPTSFCDEAIANLTQRDRGDFCGTTQWASGILKFCAQNVFLEPETKGDPTCATVQMRGIVTSSSQFSFIDMYNFLGCDKPRDDMLFLIGNNPQIPQYRMEAGIALLGSASLLQTSIVAYVAVVLCAVVMIFV